MSNKKTLSRMTETEASRAGVSSLADRPTGSSKYGYGGLTSQQLKEKFDNLPRLIKDRFNEVCDMLNSTEATKYITIGDESSALGECLYDFLRLFGERYDGIGEKNISDCIKVRYQKRDESEVRSVDLYTVVQDIQARLVDIESSLKEGG